MHFDVVVVGVVLLVVDLLQSLENLVWIPVVGEHLINVGKLQLEDGIVVRSCTMRVKLTEVEAIGFGVDAMV